MDNVQNTEAWSNWTEGQKKTLREHLNYKLNCLNNYVEKEIKRINEAWKSGPVDNTKKLKPIKKPESCLDSVLFKNTTGSRRNKMQQKAKQVQSMTDEEFNDYLNEKKGERNISSHSETFESDNLDTIAEKLETKFKVDEQRVWHVE